MGIITFMPECIHPHCCRNPTDFSSVVYTYIYISLYRVHLGISWNRNCSLQTFLFRKKKAEVVEPAVISEELLIEGVEELNFVAGKQLFTQKNTPLGDLQRSDYTTMVSFKNSLVSSIPPPHKKKTHTPKQRLEKQIQPPGSISFHVSSFHVIHTMRTLQNREK